MPSVSPQSKQWISSNAAVTQAHDSSGSEGLSVPGRDGEKSAGGEGIEANAGSDLDRDDLTATRSNSTAESVFLESSSEWPETQSTDQTTAESSHTTRPAKPVERLSVRDRKKLRYGAFLAAKDKEDFYQHATWSEVTDLLERIENDPYTKKEKGIRYKEILIPEETFALLAGILNTSMQENIWYIPVHNGCRVQVLHSREGDGIHRRAILSGSKHVIGLVENQFKRAHQKQVNGDPLVDVTKPPFPIFASTLAMHQQNKPIPLVRAVWEAPSRTSMTLDDALADRPTLNSVKGFTEHVEDLILSTESPVKRQKGDEPEIPFQEQVARQLLALFQQDSSHKFISTAALNYTLEFLYKHEFLSIARIVFIRAEQVATTDSYNILLRHAARRQDKRVFRRFLRLMSGARLRPNPQTWIALLEAMVSPSEKAALLSQMAHKGYMNDLTTIRSALHLTIQDSLLSHLESGQSIDAFLLLMTKTYGADWFNASLVSQMFAAIARLHDYTAMKRLLHLCTKYSLELNTASLLSILKMFRSNADLAVDYTIVFLNQQGKLSRDAYERLFLLAFKSRRFNICRVLWRYACMDGAVTIDMKQAVVSSLRHTVPDKGNPDSLTNMWLLNAGIVIVGIDLHLTKYKMSKEILELLPPEFRQNPLLYLAPNSKNRADQDLREKLARYLVQRDYKFCASQYVPGEPLGLMLEAAAIIDRQWQGKPWPSQWRMQNAIRVELMSRWKQAPY